MGRIRQHNGVSWLEFDLLAGFDKLRHGVFLRRGGVSSGNHDSLNVGGKVGDSEENVTENRRRLMGALAQGEGGVCLRNSFQVHETAVVEVKANDGNALPTCDGLTTRDPKQMLLVKQADCQVGIFYDPVQHAVALAHAGWRGSVQNIYRQTIDKMKSAYGSRPENLLVCISPSLGPQSAEFKNYRTELPESFWEFQVKPTYFDFWAISEWQLKRCGVQTQNIEIARIDTYTTPEDWFSHRRDKPGGRNGTAALLL